LGAYAHQDLPFESLLGALNPRRDLARTPIFQVWFNFVNIPEEAVSFGELRAEPLGAQAVDAKFDLSLYVTEAEGAIDLDAVYQHGSFRPVAHPGVPGFSSRSRCGRFPRRRSGRWTTSRWSPSGPYRAAEPAGAALGAVEGRSMNYSPGRPRGIPRPFR
jgi:hypothetical protein